MTRTDSQRLSVHSDERTEVFPDWNAFELELQNWLELFGPAIGGNTAFTVLDAGCGARAHLRPKPGLYIVGIDVSESQLSRNPDLDEKIVGDIQQYDLGKPRFDLAVCWDVMEHLSSPETALSNIESALRPGGLLLLVGPNPLSVKGLVTKLTPHGFHTWFHRRVLGGGFSGVDDDRFPTPMRLSIGIKGLRRFAQKRGIKIVRTMGVENPAQVELRRRLRIRGRIWRVVGSMVRLISFGAVDASVTDIGVIMQKPSVD